jgi:2-methylcitrate dehydratase
VKITTTDGSEFTKQLDYPKGDPRNPLSDREIEEKFQALAEPVMTKAAMKRAIDAIWSLENTNSVSDLMRVFKADK